VTGFLMWIIVLDTVDTRFFDLAFACLTLYRYWKSQSL